LRASGIFPAMVVQMIGAGESTGALDAMLGKIADFYEDEVDVAVKGLLTFWNPCSSAVLGVIVAARSSWRCICPLFDLINQLS
jgi:type IV pilus assembly protein PilC